MYCRADSLESRSGGRTGAPCAEFSSSAGMGPLACHVVLVWPAGVKAGTGAVPAGMNRRCYLPAVPGLPLTEA